MDRRSSFVGSTSLVFSFPFFSSLDCLVVAFKTKKDGTSRSASWKDGKRLRIYEISSPIGFAKSTLRPASRLHSGDDGSYVLDEALYVVLDALGEPVRFLYRSNFG